MSDAAERHWMMVEDWNGPMGRQWAAAEAHTERALVPATQALLASAAARPGERVQDIGCGCGGSTLAFAQAVGPTGHVTGLDVTTPMLDVAQGTATAANVEYILTDASASVFPDTQLELLVSRF
jgi:ubiquinone/menaquinone biosynthesis C-methylase UbiE